MLGWIRSRMPGLADEAPHLDAPVPAPASSPAAESIAPAELDTERQRQARRYARQRQRLSLVSMGITTVVIGVLLFTRLGFALRDALAPTASWMPIPGWEPLRVAAYFAVLLVALTILDLPLSLYGGFVLPRRYGMSTQSFGAWTLDQLKGLALSLPVELAAVTFVYWLLAAAPSTWWLWTGLALLIFTVVLSNLLPVLLLPIFYKLTPLPDGDVKRRALALAERARTRVRGIYILHLSAKTTAANAMVTGLGNTRRIVIGDTLLDHYAPDEIEVVVAHELGHQVHRDIPKLIAVSTIVTLGGLFIANLALHAVVSRITLYSGLADAATLPLVGAVLGVFGLVTLPLNNGFSRLVEHQADTYALETTGKVDAFISAMTRLANQNLSELDPSPIIEFILYNHPSVGRRIAFAHRYAAQHGIQLAAGHAHAE
jgi:STE24 endopeptidase